jgi:predicted O-linked N-acetylglucosamine transferase (SPINDLY family)
MPSYGSPVWRLLDKEKRNPYWGEMEHYHNFSRQRLYDLLEETGFSPLNYSISDRYRVGMEIVAQLRTSATIRPNPKREETGADQSEVFSNALALHQQGKLPEAKKLYEELLNKNPNHFDALHLSGVLSNQLQRLDEAEIFYVKAIRINPSYAPLHCHRGNMLKELGRLNEALASYDKAISIKADYADALNNRGNTLKKLKKFDDALASYDKAILIKSDFATAFYNRGNILEELRRFDEALASHDKAITLQKHFALAFNNRGNTLQELRRFDEALASYDKAISIKSDFADALNNRGNTLKKLKRFDEALASYDKAISIKSDYEWLFGSLLHLRMRMSDWSNLEQTLNEFQVSIFEMKRSTSPFPILVFFEDLELNLRAARQWIDNRFQTKPLASPFTKNSTSTKIRIGYFSADFHNHATAYLMAELFEKHDRNKFELFAFSFGSDSDGEMRKRLEVSFDKFIDVRFQNDQEVAELSRNLGIDIAIDLKGFTENARTAIFANRCAPVQVNYIGYPGTMAAEYIDYIIADKILIPVESQRYYSEKIVYLPGSYQVNDSKREISKKCFTRIELGLPKEGFVFCCFNNSYKILPAVFDSWMRILKAVDGSVLWLLDDNDTSTRNLRREASNRGISPERLVFAKRLPLADHLARHRGADLFLDTHPCNAHTTASDSLWAGLPVLTRIGASFAARVAASLLNAIGLPELITTSVVEYEQLAIRLATHPDEMRALKQKLSDQRLSSKLFDTPLYAMHLEAAYTEMYERYQAGLEPDHIYIQDERKTVGLT